MGAPYYYDYINVASSEVSPSTIHAHDTATVKYFEKYFLQRAMSVFKFKIPSHWAKEFFLYCIFQLGFVSVFETDKFGVIFQPCGLYGYNVFYQPTNCIIANPLLRGNLKPRIGKECELIKLQPGYSSIMDIVKVYANAAAMCIETALVNLENSKMSYFFSASDKSGAESLKKMIDQAHAGNPAVFIDKLLLREDGSKTWDTVFNSIGQNYIVSNVLQDMSKINAMFDTEIGIPSANTDKRERLITDEVNANNIETYSKVQLWFETLTESIERVNKMFDGLDISVEWRNPPKVKDTENSDSVDGGEEQ